MAIIDCKECGASISDSALECQKCGVKLREPKRGAIGIIAKWSFIGFNILMAVWLFGGLGSATEGIESMSSAEQAGTAIGAGIAAAILSSIWVFGDIILGLFVLLTRPK